MMHIDEYLKRIHSVKEEIITKCELNGNKLQIYVPEYKIDKSLNARATHPKMTQLL